MTKLKPIVVGVTAGPPELMFVIAGVDRRKVLDAALTKIPASVRKQIAQDLRGVLEGTPPSLPLKNKNARYEAFYRFVDPATPHRMDQFYLYVHECEVI